MQNRLSSVITQSELGSLGSLDCKERHLHFLGPNVDLARVGEFDLWYSEDFFLFSIIISVESAWKTISPLGLNPE